MHIAGAAVTAAVMLHGQLEITTLLLCVNYQMSTVIERINTLISATTTPLKAI